MADCIFCKIAAKEIKSDLVAETEDCLAFKDLNPQAPTHLLVIPKKHITSLNELTREDESLIGRMLTLAAELARKEKIDQEGYRTLFNTNKGAGQTVFHLHLHVIGGRPLHWPPG